MFTFAKIITNLFNMNENYQQPTHSMGFVEAIKVCFSKYVTFSGRASRSEYWWWTLFNVLISMVLNMFSPDATELVQYTSSGDFTDLMAFYGAHSGFYSLSFIVWLALLLPSLAVTARRLHDIGCSAWWMLLYFTCIGGIAIFVMTLLPSQHYPNQYGPVPGTEGDDFNNNGYIG